MLTALLAVLVASAIAPAPAAAQTPPDAAAPPLVARVTFEGNHAFDAPALRLRVRTAANRRFLGIPGFTWWRWIYDLGDSGRLGGALSRALKAGGEAPALLDPLVLAADAERLGSFYRQEGFRDARVEARVDTLSDRRVAVAFHIEEGRPTYIRHVRYAGLDSLTAPQQQALARASILAPVAVDEGAPLSFRADGQRYSEPTLVQERRRMLTFLRESGYALVARDSIRAVIYPATDDSFDVVLRVRPGPRLRVGDIHFDVQGPLTTPLRRDTFAVGDGLVTTAIDGEARLRPALLLRTLQTEPGAWYDESRLLATKRRLEATGVFTYTDIARRPPDSSRAGALRLPLAIDLRTRRRHGLRAETFVQQRSGSAVIDAENELGTGLGIRYDNYNLFGRGEAFRVRTLGSIATDLDTRQRSLTSVQWEVSAALTYPYLIRPFAGLERALGLYDARTRLSLSLLVARRNALRLVIRGRGAARYRLELQHAPRLTSLVDLVDLSISNPDTLEGFRETFLNPIIGTPENPIIVDPVERAAILEDYTRPQINNALRYTLRAARLDPLRRTRGYSYEASAEIGGNLPWALDRFVFSPDTLEGSIPPLPIFGGGRDTGRLRYRQYVRAGVDARRYRPLGGTTVLAGRFQVGVAHPIGQANVVPFGRRFYSGGAGSVRGWHLRELGPGALDLDARTDTLGGDQTNLFGGEIKIEAGLELRQTVLRGLLAADWIGAAFVDAGNVWLGPRNPGSDDGRFAFSSAPGEIGVGAGAGLRLAWDFLIVRFDAGYKVFDPARPEAGALPDGLRRPLLHFGIGHAF